MAVGDMNHNFVHIFRWDLDETMILLDTYEIWIAYNSLDRKNVRMRGFKVRAFGLKNAIFVHLSSLKLRVSNHDAHVNCRPTHKVNTWQMSLPVSYPS